MLQVYNGLSKSSAVKCSEHNEDVFPGTHIFVLSNTKSIHLFLLFCFIGHFSLNNGTYSLKCFSGSPTLLQRAATDLSGIFHGLFSTFETDTNKTLELQTNKSSWTYVTTTSQLPFDQEETNANGRTKWWQTSKTWKSHRIMAFRGNPKISSGNVIIIMLSLLLLSFRKEIIRKDTAFLFERKS